MKKDPKVLRQRASALVAEAERIENAQAIVIGKLALRLYETGELKDEQLKAAIEAKGD